MSAMSYDIARHDHVLRMLSAAMERLCIALGPHRHRQCLRMQRRNNSRAQVCTVQGIVGLRAHQDGLASMSTWSFAFLRSWIAASGMSSVGRSPKSAQHGASNQQRSGKR